MVRHRMRSQRGRTRGGSARPQTEQNPEPAASSPSPEMYHPHSYGSGRYPNTRSGRGRDMSPGEGRRDFAVHTANFPLPSHPAPHSTQFRFRSTLNTPVITATITILFNEDNEHPDTQAENSDLWQEEALRHKNGRDTGKNLQNEGNIALHGQTMGGGQHAEGGSSSATHSPGGIGIEGPDSKAAAGCHGDVQLAGGPHGGASSSEEDDWTKYAYLIVEESFPDELK